jgi:hypothetical protein
MSVSQAGSAARVRRSVRTLSVGAPSARRRAAAASSMPAGPGSVPGRPTSSSAPRRLWPPESASARARATVGTLSASARCQRRCRAASSCPMAAGPAAASRNPRSGPASSQPAASSVAAPRVARRRRSAVVGGRPARPASRSGATTRPSAAAGRACSMTVSASHAPKTAATAARAARSGAITSRPSDAGESWRGVASSGLALPMRASPCEERRHQASPFRCEPVLARSGVIGPRSSDASESWRGGDVTAMSGARTASEGVIAAGFPRAGGVWWPG